MYNLIESTQTLTHTHTHTHRAILVDFMRSMTGTLIMQVEKYIYGSPDVNDCMISQVFQTKNVKEVQKSLHSVVSISAVGSDL